MNKSSNENENRPSCVAEMLNRVGEAADAFQNGEPLGPYIVETLLEDIHLCPALDQADDDGTRAQLEQAIERTRLSIRMAASSPSIRRDIAAQELRTAVATAKTCLDQWLGSLSSASDNRSGNDLATELASLDSPRCRNCAFASG